MLIIQLQSKVGNTIIFPIFIMFLMKYTFISSTYIYMDQSLFHGNMSGEFPQNVHISIKCLCLVKSLTLYWKEHTITIVWKCSNSTQHTFCACVEREQSLFNAISYARKWLQISSRTQSTHKVLLNEATNHMITSRSRDLKRGATYITARWYPKDRKT